MQSRGYLLATLIMRHRKTISDFDFCAIVASDAQHGPNNPLLIRVPPQGMVENGKEDDGLNRDGQRR